jgi:hypothetical protein
MARLAKDERAGQLPARRYVIGSGLVRQMGHDDTPERMIT